MRFRVIRTWHDDVAFGYTGPSIDEMIGDWLTKAEAKAIYRHYSAKQLLENNCTISVEVMTDEGWWHNCSAYWAYRQMEEQSNWFDEKGFDYDWWLMFGEIKKIS